MPCLVSAMTLHLEHGDFTGTRTTPATGEIRVSSGDTIVSTKNFRRPIAVEAEMKTDGATQCISMTLFAANDDHLSEIALMIGASGSVWRFYPGNHNGNMGSVTNWRKVKLELDELDNVKYYIDDSLKYSTTSDKKEGKLRFIAGCRAMKIRNITICNKI